MQIISFCYNKFYITSTTIIIVAMMIVLLASTFLVNNSDLWIIFIPLDLIFFCIVRFFIINFSLPMLKNKPALTLDEDKLVSFIADETIYWKNVSKFRKYGGLSYDYFLFEMSNGDVVRIGTKWIEENANLIYNNIQVFLPNIPKNQ